MGTQYSAATKIFSPPPYNTRICRCRPNTWAKKGFQKPIWYEHLIRRKEGYSLWTAWDYSKRWNCCRPALNNSASPSPKMFTKRQSPGSRKRQKETPTSRITQTSVIQMWLNICGQYPAIWHPKNWIVSTPKLASRRPPGQAHRQHPDVWLLPQGWG